MLASHDACASCEEVSNCGVRRIHGGETFRDLTYGIRRMRVVIAGDQGVREALYKGATVVAPGATYGCA
jgi:hypothetical protein